MTLLCVAESALPEGLQGEQRKLFDMIVTSAGGDPDAVIHMGVHSTTKIREAKDEYPTMAAALAEIRPTKIIALGGTAATIVMRSQTKVPITKVRGQMSWIEYEGGRAALVCTISPAAVLKRTGGGGHVDGKGSRDWFRDLLRDVTKWVEQDEPLPLPELEARTLRPATVAALSEALAALQPYQVLSCDLETEPGEEELADLRSRVHDHTKARCSGCSEWTAAFPTAGLDVRRARIMSLGFGTVNGPQVIVRRPLLEDPEAMELLWSTLWLDGHKIIGHNFKFDLQFLAHYFEGHAPQGAQGGDTMLLSWLLDERPVRSMYRTHGLKDISRYRYDIPDYGFSWPRFWAEPDETRDWDSLDLYHAMDVHQTARLWFDLGDEADEQPSLWRVHDEILWPATLAFAEAELRGIPIDREYLLEYRRKLDRRLARRLAALRSATGDPEFNPGSGAEVEELIFGNEPGFGLEPVAFAGFKTAITTVPKRNSRKEQLAKLATEQATRRQARIIRMITDYRHDMKARETYAEGLLRSSAMDGRAHSNYNLAGAVTGRLSSTDPNLQNIPKRGPTADTIRRAFRAPPGYVLMEADYSQLELRVAALLSRDQRFAAVYREGRDIHREVAAVMFHKPAAELDYMERYLAKAVDFGALYGRSGKAISVGAEMEYYEKVMGGTKWTAEEAQAFVDRFLDGFPNLRRWMNETAAISLSERRLETPFGRIRRFPLILKEDRGAIRRQSFNTPIQSVASDICLSAFCRLSYTLDPDEARILLTIHDSIMLEVRADAVPRVARQVRDAMMDIPRCIADLNTADLGIPFVVDVKTGESWRDSDMHDVDLEEHEETRSEERVSGAAIS